MFSSPFFARFISRKSIIFLVIVGLVAVAIYFGTKHTKSVVRSSACDAVEKQLASLLTGSNVIYYKHCFVPQELTIKRGASIIFTDYGDDKMWVATDPYPKEDGLRGFNSGQAWEKGQSYGYTFQNPGTYGYHNHLKPQDTGTIIVKK